MKHFMLDIESTGVDFKSDDIIQIALLEVTPQKDGTYLPGKSYQRTLFTDIVPKDQWVRDTHRDLLELCREQTNMPVQLIRQDILSFFRSCGVIGPAFIMGLNATTFDVPFMLEKGFFKKAGYDSGNNVVGDVHYRIYELKGAYNLATDVLGLGSRELFELAHHNCPEIKLPPGKKHDALFDCYTQLKTLNGIIRILQDPTRRPDYAHI